MFAKIAIQDLVLVTILPRTQRFGHLSNDLHKELFWVSNNHHLTPLVHVHHFRMNQVA